MFQYGPRPLAVPVNDFPSGDQTNCCTIPLRGAWLTVWRLARSMIWIPERSRQAICLPSGPQDAHGKPLPNTAGALPSAWAITSSNVP